MVSDLIAVPILLVTLGCVGIYTGWKRRSIHALLAGIEPTPIRELADPGLIEIEGRTSPVDEPFTAPITERDAVAAAWTIEEWDERGDTSTWREVARGIEVQPFEIEDGTGTVAMAGVSERDTAGKWTQTTGTSAGDGVRIEDTLLEFDTFPVQRELDPDAAVPSPLRDLHEDHGLYEDRDSITNTVDVGNKHGKRRYSEQVVEPGDDVYVLGRAEGREDPSLERLRPENAVVTTPEDDLFVLSDQDEASLENEFASSAKLMLYGGMAAIVVGLGIFAVMFSSL